MGKSVCNLSIKRHIMTSLNSRSKLGLLLVFALSYLFSCAHGEQIDPRDPEVEIWELQLTGGTQGNLNMLIKRTKIGNDIYVIAGKFYGKIHDHIGGKGEADYKLEGRIEGDFFKASFSGHSEMAEGPSYVNGSRGGPLLNRRVQVPTGHYIHLVPQPGNIL
jgi:hypothetical protein